LESGVLDVDELFDVLEGFSGGGGNILEVVLAFADVNWAIGTYVIGGGKRTVWSSDFSAGVFQSLESLLFCIS
jgi:hypothetical protein